MAIYMGRKVGINRINPGVDSVSITDSEGKGQSVSKESLIYTEAEVAGMKKRDAEIVKERQSSTTTYRTVSSETARISAASTAAANAAANQAAQDKADGVGLGV